MHWETKKKKTKLCDSLYFALLWWSGTEPELSPRYACLLKCLYEVEFLRGHVHY